MKSKLIEKRTIEGMYEFAVEQMIIDTDKHGRILITEGYGGEDKMEGGQYRWKHGVAARLLPNDTFEVLIGDWNDCTSVFEAVINGYDPDRPLLHDWTGHVIATVAGKHAN